MSAAAVRARAEDIATTLRTYLRAVSERVTGWPNVHFVGVCCVLLAFITLLRPAFFVRVPGAMFDTPVIVWTLIKHDYKSLVIAAQRNAPIVPTLLFLAVPTFVLLASKRDLSWSRWDDAKAYRNLIMVLVFIMGWAGSTFDYNMYLDRGHFVDRALLVVLALWTWRSPLALPWFNLLAILLMHESMVPLGHDDFDYRPMFEMLTIFSIGVWLSVFRWVQTKHVVFLALCCLGSYYFAAGVAKWKYGPEFSWLTENELSNLAVTSHTVGWLGFISDETFIRVASASAHMNKLNASYTLFIAEMGVILLMFLPPRISRFYWLSAALLHVGIYAFSGIFFWKWIVTDVAIYWFLSRGGEETHREIWKHKVLLLFGPALLYFSLDRVYFWPQTGVAWYDSRVLEHYQLVGVDRDGGKHPIDPATITPFDPRMIQGDWGRITRERTLSRTYGTTNDYRMMKELNELEDESQLAAIERRYGRSAYSARWKERFDEFIQRYFHNTNRYGGRRHRWLAHIGRPDHIWISPPGPQYEFDKPLQSVEVHRQRIFYLGDRIVRRPDQLLYTIDIPQ